MSGKTCFITFPKSAVDRGLMFIFPQKLLIASKKKRFSVCLSNKLDERETLTHNLRKLLVSESRLFHRAPNANGPN